jgi:hypothetical protein
MGEDSRGRRAGAIGEGLWLPGSEPGLPLLSRNIGSAWQMAAVHDTPSGRRRGQPPLAPPTGSVRVNSRP